MLLLSRALTLLMGGPGSILSTAHKWLVYIAILRARMSRT